VFDGAGDDEPSGAIANPSEYGVTQVFVVRERAGEWLRVALPVRPNGSTGWVRVADVELSVHDYRIDVFLGDHRMVVRRGGEVLVDEPVGIGRQDRPTPGGAYYTWVLIAPTNSGYGAYAYGLSGFSEVLASFAGGDGRLGIHGTTDTDSIGRDVSSGCVRVSDTVITRLVEEIGLPLGVPVEVHP
jgi:lipoprotein-anchoring transpeptidase ErfK/SrfK